MSKKLEKTLEKLLNYSVPYREGSSAFIVTSATPFLANTQKGYCIQVIEDITGLVIVDNTLLPGSGAYPTELLAGSILYGNFSELSVADGSVKVYIA